MTKSIEDYLKKPYARILIPDETGGYSAEILEFPGCFAEGETADEAMQALERAADSWIQAALDQGQAIPQPSISHGYSGRIALRLPKSLHRKVAQCAERDATSINQFILSAIATKVGAEDFYQDMVTALVDKMNGVYFVPVDGMTDITIAPTFTEREYPVRIDAFPERESVRIDALKYTREVASNETGRREYIPILHR